MGAVSTCSFVAAVALVEGRREWGSPGSPAGQVAAGAGSCSQVAAHRMGLCFKAERVQSADKQVHSRTREQT